MSKQVKKTKTAAGRRATYAELQPIARRIRTLREKSGRSKEAFAADVEISRTLYATYEAGANITAVNLLKIINGLGISVREFFDCDEFE